MTPQCHECGTPLEGVCVGCWEELEPRETMLWQHDTDALAIEPELLRAAIRLTHPDCHPLERQAEARAVTDKLLARLNLATLTTAA